MENFGTGFQYLMLILARIAALLFVAPVFSAQAINFRLRMVLSFFVAVVIYPLVVPHLPPLPSGSGEYILIMSGQVLIGLTIGFMITVIFSAFNAAGKIFSVQMGLSFSEVLDPQAQVSVPVMGTLKGMIGLLLFLAVDFQIDGEYIPAYLHIFRALTDSFIQVPVLLPDVRMMGGLAWQIDQALGVMFITALKIGIPIMGIIFITSVALGLLGRAAPQMNLMNMGIQVNIIVGLLVVLTLSPVVVPLMTDSFYRTFYRTGRLTRIMARAPVTESSPSQTRKSREGVDSIRAVEGDRYFGKRGIGKEERKDEGDGR